MLLCSVWYHYVLGQWGWNISYRLHHDASPTFAYSHLVLKSKFAMLSITTRKGNPRFSMPSKVRESLLNILEEWQHYSELWTIRKYFVLLGCMIKFTSIFSFFVQVNTHVLNFNFCTFVVCIKCSTRNILGGYEDQSLTNGNPWS